MEPCVCNLSLIGSLQWAVSIGRLDIVPAVVTLSGYCAAPRLGHLEQTKRVFGYFSKMRQAAIRFRTDLPDHSDLPDVDYDWDFSVYAGVQAEGLKL